MNRSLSALFLIASIAQTTHGQEVFLQDGVIKGRISTVTADGEQPVPSLKMKLIRRGTVVQIASTNSQGVFELRGIGPGNYSLAGSGGSGFIATGFTVGVDARNPIAAFSDGAFQIDTLAIPPTFRTLTRILRENYDRSRQPDLGANESVLFSGLVGRSHGRTNVRRASTSFQQPPDSQPPSSASVDLSHHNQEVQLDANGNLRGYIRVHDDLKGDLTSLTVYLIRHDDEVGRSLVTGDGSFTISDISEDGAYGLVVVGSMGFGGYQVKIVGSSADPPSVPGPSDAQARGKSKGNIRFVAARSKVVNSLQVGLMSAQDTRAFVNSLRNGTNIGAQTPSPSSPSSSGQTGGGGDGGGAGSSSGGGLSNLASLSGLAGLAALADRASPE